MNGPLKWATSLKLEKERINRPKRLLSADEESKGKKGFCPDMKEKRGEVIIVQSQAEAKDVSSQRRGVFGLLTGTHK